MATRSNNCQRCGRPLPMPTQAPASRLDAIRVVILAVAVFTLSLVVVVRYREELDKVNWSLVVILGMFLFGGYMLYQWQKDPNDYEVLDLLKNAETGKADLWKHLALFFAGISAWAIVQTIVAKLPATDMLLGVLAIFVGKVAVDGFSKAMERRPPAVDSGTTVINQPQGAPDDAALAAAAKTAALQAAKPKG